MFGAIELPMIMLQCKVEMAQTPSPTGLRVSKVHDVPVEA